MLDGIYSGSKAHLVNITQSLAAKVQGTKVRAQAVLPGATRSEIWDKSGKDVDALLPGMVMETADLVDAALVGYDRGEVVTIPPLEDEGQYKAFEAARLAMGPNLSRKKWRCVSAIAPIADGSAPTGGVAWGGRPPRQPVGGLWRPGSR